MSNGFARPRKAVGVAPIILKQTLDERSVRTNPMRTGEIIALMP